MKKDNHFKDFFKLTTILFEKYFNPPIKQAKKVNLTKKGVSIVNFIGFRKQCFIKEIVERFDISPSTASEHIERLFKASYVFKHSHKNDKRKVMVSLTDKGLEFYYKSNNMRYRLLEEKFLSLDKIEAENLIKILAKFTQI